MKDGFRFEGTHRRHRRRPDGRGDRRRAARRPASSRPTRITVAEPERRAPRDAHGLARCRVRDRRREGAAGATSSLLAVKPQVIEAVSDGSLGTRSTGALVVSIAAGFTLRAPRVAAPRRHARSCASCRTRPRWWARVWPSSAAAPTPPASRSSWFARCSRRSARRSSSTSATRTPRRPSPAPARRTSRSWSTRWRARACGRDCRATSRRRSRCRRMRGTAELLDETGQHPEALVDGVASPGGTTIAALERLEAGGLRAAFAEAVGGTSSARRSWARDRVWAESSPGSAQFYVILIIVYVLMSWFPMNGGIIRRRVPGARHAWSSRISACSGASSRPWGGWTSRRSWRYSFCSSWSVGLVSLL